MRFGDGASYGHGVRFGPRGHGRTYYFATSPFHYYTLDFVASMIEEPVIEKPVPPKLAWTKMNTGWNKKRGRK